MATGCGSARERRRRRDGRAMVLLAAILAASVAAEATATEASAGRVARGQYLVNLCECFVCHSPLEKAPYDIPVKDKLGAGDIISKEQRKVAPNLTPDRETGAGSWSDAQLVRAIRNGISHDGRQLSLAMPYDYLSVMTGSRSSTKGYSSRR
jgi:mono/diheme cytochrome c family protein